MGQVPIYGKTVVNTMEIGTTTTCMALVFICGMMVGNTKVNIMKTKNKDMVYTHGQMEEGTKDTGIWGNNMDSELIWFPKMGK